MMIVRARNIQKNCLTVRRHRRHIQKVIIHPNGRTLELTYDADELSHDWPQLENGGNKIFPISS